MPTVIEPDEPELTSLSGQLSAEKVGVYLVVTFVVGVTGGIAGGAVLDIEVWKAAALSGFGAVVEVVNRVGRAWKDANRLV